MSASLNSADLAMFARLGIPAALLAEAHIARVTDREARDNFGMTGLGDKAGVIFPYFNPISGQRVASRLRRDNPELEGTTPKNKYISAYGDHRHLYFAPGVRPLLTDKTLPVVVVEAEKSTLALTGFSIRHHRPLLSIGTGGCWGWRGRRGIGMTSSGARVDELGPLPDLDLIAWEGREVFVAFDANVHSSMKVQSARRALAQELGARGANIRFVSIPEVAGVNGPDDFIGTQGDEAFALLLNSACTPPQVAVAEAERMMVAFKADPNRTIDPENVDQILKTVASVTNLGQRKSLEVRAAKLIQWPAAAVRSTVKEEQARQQESAEKAKETARKFVLRSMVIDPPEVVASLEKFFVERAHLPMEAALVLAFFTLITWTFDIFDTVACLLIESATPSCGKNVVLNLLAAVCCTPYLLVSPSEATLFRIIDSLRPTILIDEAEALAGRTDRAEFLKSVIQAGYKKGGSVPRCVGTNNELHFFDVFCPKVLAAIGGMVGALLSRCIVIHMEKAPAGQVRKSSRNRQLLKDSARLREQTEAYAEQSRSALTRLYDEEPDAGYWPQLQDREAELWGPLLAHARLIGAECEARLLAAALRFSKGKQQIQAQDRNMALAIELLEALETLSDLRFVPSDLVTPLSVRDNWGDRFSSCRDDRSRAASIGKFLARFRLGSRQHTKSGASYLIEDALVKVRAHVPYQDLSALTPVSSLTAATGQIIENTATGDRVKGMTVPDGVVTDFIEEEF